MFLYRDHKDPKKPKVKFHESCIRIRYRYGLDIQARHNDPPTTRGGNHGAEVVGMFFFDDNVYTLRKGDPIGERLAKVAAEQNILLMGCDQCGCG